MAKNLIGRFYFKLTDNKNLIGEFSNCAGKKIYAESADRSTDIAPDDKFVGEYWHTLYDDFDPNELGGSCARLEIKLKSTPRKIYTLNWWLFDEKKQKVTGQIFWGEGMLCDGMLIGDYRNFPVIPTSP